jgi:FKBP-type peptidyl-prolyl cis-trans isomerase
MNNKQIITLVVVAVAALVIGYFIGSGTTGVKSEGQISLKNQDDSLNYFLGLNMGYSLSEAPWEVDADLIVSGISQVVKDSSSYDYQTAQMVFQNLNVALSDRQAMKTAEENMVNMEAGIAFLEENGKKEGVMSTESGLQYEIITEGTGPKPTAESTVSVFYEGTLIDGTVFDGNFDTGDTISFPLNGVIPGWTEGLQLMPVGSTYNLYIPSNLGYGSRAAGPIPGNSVLIFKIELLSME